MFLQLLSFSYLSHQGKRDLYHVTQALNCLGEMHNIFYQFMQLYDGNLCIRKEISNKNPSGQPQYLILWVRGFSFSFFPFLKQRHECFKNSTFFKSCFSFGVDRQSSEHIIMGFAVTAKGNAHITNELIENTYLPYQLAFPVHAKVKVCLFPFDPDLTAKRVCFHQKLGL